jgi:ArsR family transcriptional regulator
MSRTQLDIAAPGGLEPVNDAGHLGHVEVAQAFAAIGSEPRLEVLLALVRAGPEGLSVGDIQKRLNLAASTLTHHLRFLAAAGLIVQTRDGRTIRNQAAFARIEELAGYLLRECCAERATQTGACPHGQPPGAQS